MAVAIATLALAIGANAAMFSFVNAALIAALPYPDASRIVRVLERSPGTGVNNISTLNYLDWAAQNGVFEYIAAETGWRATLTGAGEPVVIRGARVSAHYFDIFGVKAARGRTFLPDEDRIGRDRVVLLSHRLWERQFSADPAIMDRAVILNGEPHTVVGILPKDGPFDRAAAQIFKPLAFDPSNMTRDFRWLTASAKLKPDMSLSSARAGMNLVAERMAVAHPASNKNWGVAVDRLSEVIVGPGLRTAVTTLFTATLFVLVIGCVNLANLTFARNVAREGEMAVRSALGALRGQLVRLVVLENMVIATCGGLVALLVGYALLNWIRAVIPPNSLPPAVDIRMNWPVWLFTLGVAAMTGFLIGMAAAMRTTSARVVRAPREGGHSTATIGAGKRIREVLIVAEVALAFVLLVSSGLLIRSFSGLLTVDPGFEARNVLTAGLPIEKARHPDTAELNIYLSSIRTAVESVPGVRVTALTSALPLEGWGFGTRYAIEGRDTSDRSNRRPAFFKIVSPSYFDALGIALRAGRGLNDDDRAGAPPVALINETLAAREFAGKNPLGQRILVRDVVAGRAELGQEIVREIVGVVANEKITGLGDESVAGLYVSNEQSPNYDLSLIVKADVPPEPLQNAIRSAINQVNRNQALSDVRTLEQIVATSMLANRVVSTLLTAFAAMALLLAAVGIYGVISYTAAQRTYEMAVRAALGASTGNLRSLVFREGMWLTVVGLAIGLAGTFVATRFLSWMLFGVGAFDPLTIVAVAVVLSGVAGLACYLPARRITTVDPMKVLRS